MEAWNHVQQRDGYTNCHSPRGDVQSKLYPTGTRNGRRHFTRKLSNCRSHHSLLVPQLPELFGFIAETDSQIVIVFRGTTTTSDWISDAIARQTPFPYAKDGGLVHQGFLDIYQSARKPLLAAMSKLSAGKQLYLTGHSLGGSLATLCAADLAANTKFTSPSVYTFGSPRVGNPSFAKLFNLRTGPHYRVFNRNDMVPSLPPLVYKSPRTGDLYHYIHVKKAVELVNPTGSLAGNHAVSNYYHEVAKLDPKYAKLLSARTPGFCPK
ncbi:lipase family protein [Paenibacillus roseipurpureus]|uniref:Lipase family protein n=1 Tax=Paenibacillus roseopurpureus TaxID=2918901 RepID=A0AA96RKI3_9BACL|nr:lipase family protein [Paenibacillus sp. MBLB1832]WNR44346.1 lipase family protein [Paenibacillus sp. MBLB1832]